MTPKSSVEVLISVAQAPELGPNNYSNEGPLIHQAGGHVAFGGSLISQAAMAASATVPDGFSVYSSQSSFLRPVNAREKVNYRVEHASDGRTFATRVVYATQAGGPSLYIAVISFQRHSSGNSSSLLTYANPMPAVGHVRPLDVPRHRLRQHGFQPAHPIRPSQDDSDDEEEPFDWRPLTFEPAQDPSRIYARGFVCSSKPLFTKDYSYHLGALAFLSDQCLLELMLFLNLDTINKQLQSLVMSTTLTSQISFHNHSVKADQWMVCESNTSWGARGRVMIHQRLWSLETGDLVLSCTQEAVIGMGQPRL